MQAWLQPMQASTSRRAPRRRLRDELGVGDQRARHPDRVGGAGRRPAARRPRRRRRASCAITGTSTAARTAASGSAIAASGTGGGGAIQLDAADVGGVAEHERGEVDQPGRAQLAARSPRRPARRAPPAPARRPRAGRRPPSSGPAAARTAASTSSAKRSRRRRRAVRVRAPVRARREELRDQVAVRHRDLDAVDPALAAVARGGRVAVDQRAQLGSGQRPRLAREARRRHRRGRDRRRPRRGRDLLAAAVEELDEQPRPVLVHRAGEPLGSRRRSPAGSRRACATVSRPDGSHGGRLEEDRPDPAARARRVVGDEVGRRQVVVHQPGLVRRRHDPVAQARTGPRSTGVRSTAQASCFEHPLAAARPSVSRSSRPPDADAEDGLVLVGAGAVDDLDQRQLAGSAPGRSARTRRARRPRARRAPSRGPARARPRGPG